MFWKLKRRLRNGFLKNGFYYGGVVICIVLFFNMMAIQRNFETLNGENYVDAGGTSNSDSLVKLRYIEPKPSIFQERKLHSRLGLRYMFENRLRRLLDIMEATGEKSNSYGLSDGELPFDTYFPDRLLYCDDILNITDMVYLASGWTKAVYKGLFKNTSVAVKTVDVNGQDVRTCVATGRSHTSCYVKAAKKIVKEIVVLQALANENVLKVLGFCLPRDADDNPWVAMVTELGEAVDLIKLLQMTWEDRLRICVDITKIVNMMSDTPYGSMSMNDFRRQQFVLVDGTLKLSDVDDSAFEDPVCRSQNDCKIVSSSANFSESTKCVQGKCVEYNEKLNLFNAGRHFVTFLLPHGAPLSLRPITTQIIDAYNNLTMTSEQLLMLMNKLTYMFQSGAYLNRTGERDTKTIYKRLDKSDMPGEHDYRCRLSVSMATCSISVHDVREAEDICDRDAECKGFVLSQQTTWTGRKLVHMKDGVGKISFNANTTLFLKPIYDNKDMAS